jgi:hypothetical protein
MTGAMDRVATRPSFSQHTAARVGVPLLVAGICFAAFAPALDGAFVNFDDLANFTDNPRYRGLSASHLAWMFSHFDGHYQPVTWLSHGVDYVLFGLDPRGYHWLNLLLHCASAILVYRLLLDLVPRRQLAAARDTSLLCIAAGIGALLFAIHPLRVESVAWITQRKDVLFLFFALGSLLFYLRAHPADGAATRPRGAIGLSLLCFALSMLSKSMCMTLPALLLLLDAYPLGRIGSRQQLFAVLREKVPYFAIMLAGIAAEIVAELKSHVIDVDSNYGLADVVTQPAYRLSFYLWKTVWPVDLQPMYIFPLERDPTDAIYALCAAGVLATSFALVVLARRTAAPLAAWLAFALLLSPVLGLLQAGYHFAADRYTYFAGIVPAALLATGLVQLWLRGRLVWVSAALALALLTGLGTMSHRQSKIWRSSNALWLHAVDVDPGNYIGHYNLAHDYASHDDFDRAIDLDTEHWQAYSNRGTAHSRLGDLDAAVTDFTRALEIRPNLPGTYAKRARAFEQLGETQAARADRQRSRSLQRRQ